MTRPAVVRRLAFSILSQSIPLFIGGVGVLWTVYILGGLAAAGLLVLAYTALLEPRLFRFHRIGLSRRDLGLPRLRILHVTDTHFHGRDEPKLNFLRTVATDEAFDLVLYGGDIIHSPGGVESVSEMAALFEPPLGSFAVLGGHDYVEVPAYATYRHLALGDRLTDACPPNPAEEVVRRLRAEGVEVLRDRNVRVSTPEGVSFAVVGLRDVFEFEPDYEAAWDGLSEDTPVIVLAHSPDVLPEVSERGASLAFFGHTHGGQVRLPLIGALVTRTRLSRRAARGAFRCGRTLAVLDTGLGAAPAAPYRLLCRPEVVEVTLGDADGPAAYVKELHVD